MANVVNKNTFEYKSSVNTPDYSAEEWLINPDLSGVWDVPLRYWKVVGSGVFEMTDEEKAAVDYRPPSRTDVDSIVAKSPELTSTTSTQFLDKLVIQEDLAPMFSGTGVEAFRIRWYYEWGASNNAWNQFEGRLRVDDKEDLFRSAWYDFKGASEATMPESGFADVLLSSGTHSFHLQFRSTKNNRESRVQNARLTLTKIPISPDSPEPPTVGL